MANDLQSKSIKAWILSNKIVNEKGDRIDLINDHYFLLDIYGDQSQFLVVLKAAQVGLSTLEIIKNHFDAKQQKMDIIYTLPTDNDVKTFVGGKVNRIIANNPVMLADVADKDSIEQKAIGQSMEYFRGTWSPKAAIMVTADRLVHDEKDSSKQPVIKDYEARLQHSKYKQIHVFSHPSSFNTGVDIEWQQSDQKEWFIKCPHCAREQYLSWSIDDPKKMSVDLEREIFICKKCHGELSSHDRAFGEWRARKFEVKPKWSGYHISLLMAPWITAAEIVSKWKDVEAGRQSTDYFYNKVLGLPYAGSGNSATEDMILGMWTKEKNSYANRLIMGVDTGIFLRYVIGNKQGLVSYGQVKAYVPDEKLGIPLSQTLEYFLIKFPNLIMLIDQGGDIIGSRQLQKKYPGRVFLCYYQKDKQSENIFRFGENNESGRVLIDRNRAITLVLNEARERRFALYGTAREDWYDYWLHWSHIRRTSKENNLGVLEYVWERSDRDDWVHATVYWRAGIDRFGKTGFVIGAPITPEPNSYMIDPDLTVSFNPDEMFRKPELAPGMIEDESGDWRDR
jgi:hypothetical protein